LVAPAFFAYLAERPECGPAVPPVGLEPTLDAF
jgi:hypothetical protein